MRDIVEVKTHAGGAVGLWITIDQQSFKFQYSETRGEIYSRGSFSYPAFLIGNSDYSSHSVPYLF
jgi:hypothetical protein